MKTVQFKTNIKCSGCIAKVTPELNKAVGQDNWEVDLQTMDKVLTVSVEGLNETSIQEAVEKAGYKAEKIEHH
jgi:copper chaperone CopZ